jgi:hypothetical protein
MASALGSHVSCKVPAFVSLRSAKAVMVGCWFGIGRVRSYLPECDRAHRLGGLRIWMQRTRSQNGHGKKYFRTWYPWSHNLYNMVPTQKQLDILLGFFGAHWGRVCAKRKYVENTTKAFRNASEGYGLRLTFQGRPSASMSPSHEKIACSQLYGKKMLWTLQELGLVRTSWAR